MGAGYHRGGPGVVKSWYFSHGEAIGSSLGDGEVFGPWGYEGGKGAPGSTLILAKDTTDEEALAMFLTGAEIAKDKTVINRVYHLDRGYEGLEKKLRKCKAKIS